MTERKSCVVVFLDQGIRGRVPEGTTLLAAAQALGAELAHVCGGAGTCSTCRVLPAVNPGNLSPLEPNEAAYDMGPGVRLGCQARVRGDVGVRVVRIPNAVLP